MQLGDHEATEIETSMQLGDYTAAETNVHMQLGDYTAAETNVHMQLGDHTAAYRKKELKAVHKRLYTEETRAYAAKNEEASEKRHQQQCI
jgi:hypothetical protein